jgi:hypothetical protein
MASLFSTPKVSSTPAIQYVMETSSVDPTSEEAKEKADEEAEKQRKAANAAKGAASTILTGGLGVEEEATVKRKKLFGE